MPVLEAHSVVKTFVEGRETVEVLRGISLSVERGEVVALEGPSGSGKTTLLSILGCILTPSGGRVVVDGEAVDTGDPKVARHLPAIRKRAIGFVFQQYNLFPALTALENVEYALNVKGGKGRRAHEEATSAHERVRRIVQRQGQLGDSYHCRLPGRCTRQR